MRVKTPIVLSVLAVMWSGPTSAQSARDTTARTTNPPSLDELMRVEVETVVSATRREQLVTEAPSAVTILTAHDIRTFGWRTMADALASVRGFYTTYDRNYSYVGVRGFGRPSDYNNRVLVLVNGHRFNDNIYDQALVGTEFPIDLALVERIEVIRGPGSALYGGSAFFAVVNVILRRGGAIGSEAALEAGEASTFRLRGTYGARSASGVESLLSVSRTTTDGQDLYFPEYDGPSTGFGVARHADGDESTSLVGRLDMGRLTLQGAYGSRSKHIPTGAYGTTFGDTRTQTTDSRGWIDASLAGSRGLTTLTARGFVDYTGYRGSYFFDEGTLENRDTADGVWLGTEVMASRRLGRRHQMTTGIEYRFNARQDQRSWDVDPFFEYVNDRRRSHQAAIYVQDEIRLHRTLTAVIGGRYDWWELVGGTGRPRAGLIYRRNADTAIKFLYGAAYRPPTVFEKYYNVDPHDEPLRPEQVDTSELVYERYVGGQLRLSASVYLTDVRRLIGQAGEAETIYFHNESDHVHSRGLELEAERRWPGGALVRASYVTQRTRDRLTDNEAPNSPRRLGLVHAVAPLIARRLTMAAEAQYTGSRLTYAGARTDGAWLTNLNLTLLPTPRRLTLGARVTNVFDTKACHPVGLEFRQDVIPQDGRSVSLRATFAF